MTAFGTHENVSMIVHWTRENVNTNESTTVPAHKSMTVLANESEIPDDGNLESKNGTK